MYENGKRMNRYANKMIHKRKMKQRYMNHLYGGSYTTWEDYISHNPWGVDYWHYYSLSSMRSWVSRCASRKMRNEFRVHCTCEDYDNIVAPQSGQFKKYYDYWWMIY